MPALSAPGRATLNIDDVDVASASLMGAYAPGGACFVQLGAIQFGAASDPDVHRLAFDNVIASPR